VDVAQRITGKGGLDIVPALKANPELLDAFKLEVENMAQVNTTMQTEAISDHWPTYSWRPSIGFAVAYNVVIISTLVFIVFAIAIFTGHPEVLQYIPPMIMADAALLATVLPILGIASYWRGKMQASPLIPTDNRG
jgi:hypothetical protein